MKAYNHAAAVARKQAADTCMNSSCHESKQAANVYEILVTTTAYGVASCLVADNAV